MENTIHDLTGNQGGEKRVCCGGAKKERRTGKRICLYKKRINRTY